ncbi:23S rRNA methyltransferase [Microlunatus elymi]|uniref:23S rRNA methyltransferase n=2 Tax=Microlunatus elymi TaxID=2596828 RepID=A0A516Q645_9ACTN|nr:23S rRNA methyltransferase [Microlunatus elymi]
MSLERIVDLLQCPHCRQPVTIIDRALRCSAGHSFDIARQGYVNLLTKPAPANADTSTMIAARERFLAGDHYRPVAERIAALAEDLAVRDESVIVEPGAGTGYYLGRVVDQLSGARGVAADLSAAGCQRAARIHDRIGAVVADTWAGLPIKDDSADLIMVVFAPRNPADFARILRTGGRLVVVAAGPDHLTEIRAPLGLLDVQPDKQHRLTESLADHFTLEHTEQLTGSMILTADNLYDLVSMGPNAHHQGDDLRTRIDRMTAQIPVTRQIELFVFRRQ